MSHSQTTFVTPSLCMHQHSIPWPTKENCTHSYRKSQTSLPSSCEEKKEVSDVNEPENSGRKEYTLGSTFYNIRSLNSEMKSFDHRVEWLQSIFPFLSYFYCFLFNYVLYFNIFLLLCYVLYCPIYIGPLLVI